MAVFLSDEQVREVDAEDLLSLTRHVLADRRVPEDMEVSLLLVDEETMAALNRQHMQAEGPTDVLAFPIDEPGETPPDQPAILGDVVLCPAVCAAQAPRFSRSEHEELQVLTVHGLLHLLGMDHADPVSEAEMFGLTDQLVAAHRGSRS